jgi:uncharacterized membrane protein
MSQQEPTQEDYDNWQKDPNNWIWGFIYYNPKDNRLLPPKRIASMGYTLNFANPYSVAIAIALLALIPLALLSK